MLLRIHPPMRKKVSAILRDLEAHGWQPRIDSGVWRSPGEQRRKVEQGHSRVLFSFHNASTPNGRADSLAADITDERFAWNSPKKFWLMLAASAEAHGLTTGIRWGLTKKQRAAIDSALAARDFDNSKIILGWDTAHVEPKNFSLAQAKRGERPQF